MQPFPRLMLDGIRIALQFLHLLLQLRILLFEIADALFDGPALSALLLVGIHAVRAKERVIPEEERAQHDRARRDPAPHSVHESRPGEYRLLPRAQLFSLLTRCHSASLFPFTTKPTPLPPR